MVNKKNKTFMIVLITLILLLCLSLVGRKFSRDDPEKVYDILTVEQERKLIIKERILLKDYFDSDANFKDTDFIRHENIKNDKLRFSIYSKEIPDNLIRTENQVYEFDLKTRKSAQLYQNVDGFIYDSTESNLILVMNDFEDKLRVRVLDGNKQNGITLLDFESHPVWGEFKFCKVNDEYYTYSMGDEKKDGKKVISGSLWSINGSGISQESNDIFNNYFDAGDDERYDRSASLSCGNNTFTQTLSNKSDSIIYYYEDGVKTVTIPSRVIASWKIDDTIYYTSDNDEVSSFNRYDLRSGEITNIIKDKMNREAIYLDEDNIIFLDNYKKKMYLLDQKRNSLVPIEFPENILEIITVVKIGDEFLMIVDAPLEQNNDKYRTEPEVINFKLE
ncbi:hypothetical protein H9L01_00590 [Erysipelothrix inopinata]|uniref:Uncharacterized protein n=1 Tax=Erysipelothrix inopinata TaxID=225084 RepID=A0A7G9RZ82_9FIRM|nr:hypothetical protein [Erysipelothrix inopinata]QNN60907.1 hypothetical protein H9L01_00590 [Erysipelothrix inopinata]